MIVDNANLRTLYTGFGTAFQSAFDQVTPLYKRAAMVVPSATRSNEYGWLGALPRIREWIGDRVIQNMATKSYTLSNVTFESTISVPREDIEDDMVGMYAPMFSEFGRQAATFPDELVWDLLRRAWETKGFDGQNFFDTDHPVLDARGQTTSVANTDGGNETPWFLIDDTRQIKPVIYQERRKFDLIRKDQPTDDNVFMKKEYLYGTDGRCNVGFGFWQLAWGSKQRLDAAHYEAARVALARMKGDYGRPLGLRGSLLIVGPSNEGAARRLLMNENIAVGETNPWKGSAEMLVVPWLE